jgi:hypothetical protein
LAIFHPDQAVSQQAQKHRIAPFRPPDALATALSVSVSDRGFGRMTRIVFGAFYTS